MTLKITRSAILLALYITIRTIIPSIILVPGVLTINPTIIVLPFIGMLVGKKEGFVLGILADLITFFLMPAIFNPFFTLSEGMLGYFGGLFFHKKELSFKLTYFYSLITCYIGIVLLNTLGLAFQFAVLAQDLDKLKPLFTTSLLIRLFSSTFIYAPLLSSLIYFPRKQWKYLEDKL